MKTEMESSRAEFGDFQTPAALVAKVVEFLGVRGTRWRSLVEPTCGVGEFAVVATEALPSIRKVLALDIRPSYAATARSRLLAQMNGEREVYVAVADAFTFNWHKAFASLPEPLLVLGNPPWVTSAGQGALGGTNLPAKLNAAGFDGLDAITGKANFDVAEWLLLTWIESLATKHATIAMLVKTSVARRVLAKEWATRGGSISSEMYLFDATKHFGVGASACLLIIDVPGSSQGERRCIVRSLSDPTPEVTCIGWRDGLLVSDTTKFDRNRDLVATRFPRDRYRWRSGVKHDCGPVMELRSLGSNRYVNGLREQVEIESDFVYPLLKGADLARGEVTHKDRYLIVPQQRPGAPIDHIERSAPKTWAYLCRHADLFDRRASSIYRNKPRFSVFGVGDYSFAPWKVAISSLHKRLAFRVIGPALARPVLFDDTVNQVACGTQAEAEAIASILRSDAVSDLLSSLVFWDAKRPITADLLNRVDLASAALRLGIPLNSQVLGQPSLLSAE